MSCLCSLVSSIPQFASYYLTLPVVSLLSIVCCCRRATSHHCCIFSQAFILFRVHCRRPTCASCYPLAFSPTCFTSPFFSAVHEMGCMYGTTTLYAESLNWKRKKKKLRKVILSVLSSCALGRCSGFPSRYSSVFMSLSGIHTVIYLNAALNCQLLYISSAAHFRGCGVSQRPYQSCIKVQASDQE